MLCHIAVLKCCKYLPSEFQCIIFLNVKTPHNNHWMVNIPYFLCYNRRNKVAAAARKVWPGNDVPTFRNNKENLKKLDELVEKLEPDCAIPLFGKAAIRRHMLDSLNERRRSIKKGKDYEVSNLLNEYI